MAERPKTGRAGSERDGTASHLCCALCRTNAIIYLPYAHHALCKRHFLHSVESRVKRTIREFRMLDGAKHIAVALSGGKDSLTALYILKQIAGPAKIRLTAILVNEGIKGYRDKTIREAKELCKKLDVPLKIYSFRKEIGYTMDKIATSKRKDREVSCTYCGVFRRWILNKAAREVGADRIVIGHNLDDVVQSYLMNLLRNEPFRLARFGPAGGIVDDDGFVRRIRPLFRIPEREIALYAILNGLKTDFDGCPYVKEAFRPVVRNFINDLESTYPGTKHKLFNSFMHVRELLAKQYREAGFGPINSCPSCGEPASSVTCKKCDLVRNLKSNDRRRGRRVMNK